MKYGFPYQGSKNKHAAEIIAALPAGSVLYDLFAGGCAITHAALMSGKWEKIHANDLQGTPRLFCDAVAGKYRDEKRWISREQFHAEKGVDPYIRWVWSFGNNGKDYIFGRDIEPVKKAAHEYLISNGYDGTTKTRKMLLERFKKDANITKRFDLQQLQQLEQLERLQQLERRLATSALDYRKVKIKPGAIIYCDPPYPHKCGQKEKYYGVDFDAPAFYDWAKNNKNPVYFSSVFAPREFSVVWEKATVCSMNNKGSTGKKEIVERLYWNGVLK